MLVVKVELWSAITGAKTEIAQMHIMNDGLSCYRNRGNYDVATLRGRSAEAFAARSYLRRGRVENHPRLKEHVWNLVTKALAATGYGK